jgi:hypothetical protein
VHAPARQLVSDDLLDAVLDRVDADGLNPDG